jgi:hypothetical protein
MNLGRIVGLALLASACDEPAPEPVSNTPPTPAGFAVELAGPREASEGERVDLECRVTGAGEHPCNVTWMQNGLVPKLALGRAREPALSFTAPEWTADYELTLQAHVVCGPHVADRELTLRVRADDDPVRASIVAPAAVECGEQVALIAQTYNEVMQEARVAWRQVGDGPRVALEGAERHQCSFIAPEHDAPYRVELELAAHDGVNPPVIVKHSLDVACDPADVPLPSGTTLVLSTAAAHETPLPRGAWQIAGTISKPVSETASASRMRLRFTAHELAAAVELAWAEGELQLATTSLARTPEQVWEEPEFKNRMPLGPWPADVPFGFELTSNGREVKLAFGPASARDSWPELPFDIVLPIGRRPRAFAVDVLGNTLELGEVVLRAP